MGQVSCQKLPFAGKLPEQDDSTQAFSNDWRIIDGIYQKAWRVLAGRSTPKGHKPVYRTFDTQLKAQKWARRLEADIDTGFYVDNSAAEKMTLGVALEQYRREVAAKKRHPAQEYGRIDRWLRSDLCYRTLANLKGADFAKYRDQRRAQGRAENTIRLELQLVSHLYEIAR